MTFFKQTDIRWTNYKYDGVNTIGKFGCFLTCLSMLCDKTPIEVADIFRNNNLFTNGHINNLSRAAQLLGLTYDGISKVQPPYTCIAETDYYDNPSTSTKEQHFIVIEANGNRLDPLGSSNAGKYNLVSYRLFKGANMLGSANYDLFRLPSGAVYERHVDYSLTYIPNWDFLVKYYGNNPVIQDVPNFDNVGWVAVDMKNQNATLITQLDQCNTAKADLIQGSIDKVAEIEALKKEKSDLEDAVENCHELLGMAENEKAEAEKKLDKCNIALDKYKNPQSGNIDATWLSGMIEKIKAFFTKKFTKK